MTPTHRVNLEVSPHVTLDELIARELEKLALPPVEREMLTETAQVDPKAWGTLDHVPKSQFMAMDLAKTKPVAVYCTKCGKDEPGPECADCEVRHCPIRPLLKHPKRKTRANSRSIHRSK
jgi:hypothetical protein